MRTADSDDLLHLCLCSTANQPRRFRIFLCGARHVISHLLEFAYTCYRPCTATWLPRVISRGKKDWLSYSTGNIKSLIPSFSLSLSLCHIFSLSFSLSLLVFSLSLSFLLSLAFYRLLLLKTDIYYLFCREARWHGFTQHVRLVDSLRFHSTRNFLYRPNI